MKDQGGGLSNQSPHDAEDALRHPVSPLLIVFHRLDYFNLKE